jgi:hypothetical protein
LEGEYKFEFEFKLYFKLKLEVEMSKAIEFKTLPQIGFE